MQRTISKACWIFVFIDAVNSAIPDHKFLFPEYEIIREPEEIDASDINEKEQDDLDRNEVTSAGNRYKYWERT